MESDLSPQKNHPLGEISPQIHRSPLDMTTVVAMFRVTCVANGTGAWKSSWYNYTFPPKMLPAGMKNSVPF